jgi:hypothetical protein
VSAPYYSARRSLRHLVRTPLILYTNTIGAACGGDRKSVPEGPAPIPPIGQPLGSYHLSRGRISGLARRSI